MLVPFRATPSGLSPRSQVPQAPKLALLLLCTLNLCRLPSVGHGQTPTTLEQHLARAVQIPATCGSPNQLLDKLSALLRPAELDRAIPKQLQISSVGNGVYRMKLRIAGEQRQVDDRDCQALFHSAVVIIATAASATKNSPTQAPQPQSMIARDASHATRALPASTGAPPQPGSGRNPMLPRQPENSESRLLPRKLAGPKRQPADTHRFTPPKRAAALRNTDPTEAMGTETPSLTATRQNDGSSRQEATPVTSGDGNPPGATPEVHVFAGLGGASGFTPSFSLRNELMARATLGTFGIALDGYHVWSAATDGSGPGVESSALGGRLALHLQPLSFLGLALGPDVARTAGRGIGARVHAKHGAAWSLSMFAELTPRWPFYLPFQGELAVFVRVAATRPSFQVLGAGEIFRIPRWAMGFTLRLGYQLL